MLLHLFTVILLNVSIVMFTTCFGLLFIQQLENHSYATFELLWTSHLCNAYVKSDILHGCW